MAIRTIDDEPMPAWAEPYFSADQLTLPPILRWVLLIFQRTGWEASHVSVAQRMFISMAFKKRDKRDWHSEVRIARDLNLARNTVSAAMKDLAAEGWISQAPRSGSSSQRWPTWPPRDCLTPMDGPELCAAPTKNKSLCTRRAGWGTVTAGVGPCKLHGGQAAQPLSTPEEGEKSDSDPEACSTIEQVPVQQLSIPLLNRCAGVVNGWTRVHEEYISGVHQPVDASGSPYGAEVEVPQPRSATRIEEGEKGSGEQAVDDAVQALQKLYPCSAADAEAMVRLIDQDKVITNWPRYLASFRSPDFATWHARVKPTPIPPPVHTVLADQPHAEPAAKAVPVDQSVAELRARMGWSAPTSP
ncbi:hypothetical protein AB0J63_38735 [Streptosporangium canum]|uniref:hypothetical protein n=1 Tax=Streptosporangium canum TaxID=324952 RepID=UPI003440ACB5